MSGGPPLEWRRHGAKPAAKPGDPQVARGRTEGRDGRVQGRVEVRIEGRIEGRQGPPASTRAGPLPDRAAVRQGRHHEARRVRRARGDGGRPDRRAHHRRGARHRRDPPGAGHGDLRPGVLREDDPRPPRDRGGPARGRLRGVRRRRARPRRGLCQAARREHRRAADLAARHGRAGARDHRAPGPLGGDRRHRHRLRRGARAEGRARGRDGGVACPGSRRGSCRRPSGSSPPRSRAPAPP